MPTLQETGYLQPYGPTQGGLQQFYPEIFNLYGQGVQDPLSPQQRVAPLDPFTTRGIEQLGAFGQPGGAGAGYQAFAGGQLGAGLNAEEIARYADNPYIDEMITASLRDPFRQFTEQTMPGIDIGQAAGGGGSGARTDLARGVATRGFEDRAADVSAGIRGDAYQQGLKATATTRAQDLQYGELAQGMGLSNIETGLYGGGLRQDQEQQLRNVEQENFMYGVGAPWQLAENYANLATPGAGRFGTQFGDPTADFSQILQGALTQGGLDWLGGEVEGGLDWLKNQFPWL